MMYCQSQGTLRWHESSVSSSLHLVGTKKGVTYTRRGAIVSTGLWDCIFSLGIEAQWE